MIWLVLAVLLLAGVGAWGYWRERRRNVLLRRTLPYLSRPQVRSRQWRPWLVVSGWAWTAIGPMARVLGLCTGLPGWVRKRQIEASLPEALDVLALAVDTGWQPVQGVERLMVSTFNAAFAHELTGILPPDGAPLIPELVSRHGAKPGASAQVLRLQRAFVSAPEGGEVLSGLLRAQAADLRERRRRQLARRVGCRLALQAALVLLIQVPVMVVAFAVLVRALLEPGSWWAG